MLPPALALDRVSKRYRLRRDWPLRTLRDSLERLTARLLARGGLRREEFWALRDVTFDVAPGEILGLIGANGAGKTTLLRILSRVTVPTHGTFTARGRVGALIEIGAGFHHELTGRENIYLNGAIVGMTRREIARKLDRIVAFAELERFIDTPMKFYSTGMQMRLGFAVTAHTEPDILLIDEILAVGDAAFQAKCLSKLAELKAQDKTIVLVSHTMTSILDHTRAVVWLDAGRLRMMGDPVTIVRAYLDDAATRRPAEVAGGGAHPSAPGRISVLDVTLLDERERARAVFDRDETVLVDIAYAARGLAPGAVFSVTFQDALGSPLGGVLTDPDDVKVDGATERGVLRLRLPVPFNRGTYTLTVHAGDPHGRPDDDVRRHAVQLVVDGHRAADRGAIGHVHYPHRWEHLR